MQRSSNRSAQRRAQGATFVALALVSTLGACRALTEVNAPDLVERPALQNVAGATALYNGAFATFYRTVGALAANQGPYITATGMLSDELSGASVFSGVIELDQRSLGNASFGIHSNLHSMRRDALQALPVVQAVMPTQRWRAGLLYSLEGYAEVMLGEAMCSGVPLSSLSPEYAPVYGPPLTRAQLFEHAAAVFDTALTNSADSARALNIARLGRGRALLNLGRFSEAAAAVASVPTTFSFGTEHNGTTSQNWVQQHFAVGFGTMGEREGGVGLDYVSSNDPRIAPVRQGNGFDGTTPLYRPARLSSASVANPIANGIEARLIEAEAALRANDATGWLAKLNALRATAITPAMTPLVDPVNADARVNLQFRERAFWLYLTGHRLGDMRRLVAQYNRSVASVFATGTYKYGGEFGADTNFPIDPVEARSNPLMNGVTCLDRNP